MRIDHIESFNNACANVGKLASEAIAEHRRQIEQIEAIGREAAKLVRDQPRDDFRKAIEAAASTAPSFDEQPGVAAAAEWRAADAPGLAPSPTEDRIEDALAVAMRRAERQPDPATTHFENLRRRRSAEFAPAAKVASAPDLLQADPLEAAPADHHDPDGDDDGLARGRELVSSLRKRGRR